MFCWTQRVGGAPQRGNSNSTTGAFFKQNLPGDCPCARSSDKGKFPLKDSGLSRARLDAWSHPCLLGPATDPATPGVLQKHRSEHSDSSGNPVTGTWCQLALLSVLFANWKKFSSSPQPSTVPGYTRSLRIQLAASSVAAKAPASCGKAAAETQRRSSLKTLPGIFYFVWLGFVFQEPQTS